MISRNPKSQASLISLSVSLLSLILSFINKYRIEFKLLKVFNSHFTTSVVYIFLLSIVHGEHYIGLKFSL